VKRNSDRAPLTEWDAHETFPRLRDDLGSNRAGWYVADVLGRMLPPLDPHPALFETTLELLRALGQGTAIETGMLRFQWTLLVETGWQPDLTDPDPSSSTLAFDPREGRCVPDVGDAGTWRVRRQTLEALQRVNEGAPDSEDAASVQRANKLLAAHIRNVLGEEPATMAWTFGKLPVGGGVPRSRVARPR